MLDTRVREAQDMITKRFKTLCSILVLLNLPQVDGAIQFNNQATGRAAEIRDEPAQRMLPSKLQTVQLMIA